MRHRHHHGQLKMVGITSHGLKHLHPLFLASQVRLAVPQPPHLHEVITGRRGHHHDTRPGGTAHELGVVEPWQFHWDGLGEQHSGIPPETWFEPVRASAVAVVEGEAVAAAAEAAVEGFAVEAELGPA